MNKPLCSAPFTDFGIAAQSYSSCCMSYIRYEADNIHDAINHDTITQVRQSMIDHDVKSLPQACQSCIATNMHIRFQRNVEAKLEMKLSEVRDLILYPSNECSGACIMCGDEFSRTYSRTYSKTTNKIDNVDECLLAIEQSTNAESIRILGGNIQDMERGVEIFDALDRSRAEEITIVTNGNTSKMRDGSCIFTRLMKLHFSGKHVRLVISIDGVESVNNFQRKFINYERLNTFINDSKNLSTQIDVSLLSTMTMYNIERFDELSELHDDIELGIGFIVMPERMSLFNAPPEFINSMVEKYEALQNNTANKRVYNELVGIQRNSRYEHVKWVEFCHETIKKASIDELKTASPLLASMIERTIIL